ncbi:MAG: hypothetical protein RLZZ352_2080 [Pseudomonadota bacterium]|jgi:hypothetical protein
MNHDPLRILAVSALPDRRLYLIFEDWWQADVDLSDWIENTRLFKPLQDAALFAQAQLGDWGTSVVWLDGAIDMGADNLRHLATEQAGGIGHERLIQWLYDNQLTQEQGAQAIGVSRRMLCYYLSAAKPIPKTVWLACIGWAAQNKAALTKNDERFPLAA